MKKIAVLAASALAILGLASCNSEDLSQLRQNYDIDEEIKTELHINFDETTNSIRLNPEKGSATSYFDVYIPKNYNDALVVTTTPIDDSLFKAENLTLKEAVETKRFKSMSVFPLAFYKVALYTSETSQVLKEVNNSTYGLNTKVNDDFKYKFDLDLKLPTTWSTIYNAEPLLNAYKDGKTDGLEFQVAYLPILFERIYENQVKLKTYMLIPVYATYTYFDEQISLADNDKGYLIEENPVFSYDYVYFTYKTENGNTWLADKR